MKKIFSLLLAALMLMALAACGESQPESATGSATMPTKQTAPAGTDPAVSSSPAPDASEPSDAIPDGSYFDETHYTVEVDESSGDVKTTYSLKETAENKLSSEIALDQSAMTLRETTLSDLTANGWTLKALQSNDGTLESRKFLTVLATSPSGNQALIGVGNYTDSSIRVEDAQINNIDMAFSGSALFDRDKKSVDFSYAGSLSFASTPRDITAALGEPVSIVVDSNEEASYNSIFLYYKGDVDATFVFRDDGSSISLSSFTLQNL